MGQVIVGGDIISYFGISTSFVRGNYPTVLPWQPHYLTIYHEGTFILEGALHAIVNIPISIVHFSFSFYIISALLLFLVGMAREKTHSLWCFLPVTVGLICFGGPIFLTNNTGSFLSTFLHVSSWHQLIDTLNTLPIFENIKQGIGSGVTGFTGLGYTNFHAFALTAFFLFLYIIKKRRKELSVFTWYILLISLVILTLSIEELFLLIELPLLAGFFIQDIYVLPKKRVTLYIIGLLLVFIAEFFIIQNPIRDSILTPSPVAPRFTILAPNQQTDRLLFIQSQTTFNKKNYESSWFIPDLRVLIISIGIFSFFIESDYGVILSISAFVSLILGLTISNTFWSANGIRFLSLSYNLILIALCFSLLSLFKKSHVVPKIIFCVIFIILLPNIITAHARILHDSLPVKYDNYVNGVDDRNLTLEWLDKTLPINAKIIFLDDTYPLTSYYSQIAFDAMMNYGLFVPSAPVDYKVLNYDIGTEWYDASLTLSPLSLKKLGVQYIFISKQAVNRFSSIRKKELMDNMYFTFIHTDDNGTLYKIHNKFLSQQETDMTVEKMISFIPNNKTVYLTQFGHTEIRKGLIIALAKRVHLVGPTYSIGGDYPMYIETFSNLYSMPNFDNLTDVDYIFADPDKFQKPNGFGQIAKIPHTVLWKKI